MITVFGAVQALVRIDMTMPSAPKPEEGAEISPWEREAYGEGGRFGSMTSIPSGDPSKDRIRITFGGCGYSVARYLAAKGVDVRFSAVVGDDPMGMAAIEDLKTSGVDVSHVTREKGMTSVRVEARNFLGDMEFWREDESILEKFSPSKATAAMEGMSEGDIAFADGSLPEETLEALGKACREKSIKLFFDPASLEGARRGAGCLGYLHGIMPGRREAEIMSGLEILSAEQMKAAGDCFADKGVEKIAITIKGGGIYYSEDDEDGIIRPDRVLKFAETAGAGDVVAAEMLIAFEGGGTMEEAARAGMKGASEFLAGVDDERKY